MSSPPPIDARDLRPPSLWGLVREGRVVWERLALAVSLPRLRSEASRGEGEPVMVLPGISTDDGWTGRLRRFLRSIGYRAVGWGLGRNHGNVRELIPAVIGAAERLAARERQPVRLVGWSLGGYIAREVARERPDLVERVVTLGTPVVGGPAYTVTAPAYARRGYDLDAIAAAVAERETEPIRVPVFAVYSRSDGVVAWRACIDRFDNPQVEHREIGASHLGLVGSPRAFRLVAELLAHPPESGGASP